MEIPSVPPTIVSPPRGWAGPGLAELWRSRDLAYFLVWRDLKIRYRQTLFGAAWAVLQPLLLMAVFSAFLGRIAGLGDPSIPYPLFALAGLVPWTLFSQSLGAASNSLVSNQHLISKVYFPRLLLPIASVGSFVIDFVVASALLILAIVVAGRAPTLTFLLAPAFGALALATALAVGIWLAAVNVRYRDVKYAIPFIVQLWMFASPVAYSTGIVPGPLRAVYALNPLTGAVDGFRWATLGGRRPDGEIALALLITALALIGGVTYFRRVERTFADTI